jgi:Cu/Ag efflux protein CusF
MPRLVIVGRVVAALAFVLASLACRSEPPAASSATSSASVRRYTVRGEVVGLPEGGGRELSLRHEAIHDFVDRSGAVVGMNAMVMPFPVEPGVSLEGIAEGDKVRFGFAVDWDRNRFVIESLEELPPNTVLDFGKARPPGAATPSAR